MYRKGVHLERRITSNISTINDVKWFKIWIMKECNVKGSWIKEFNIGSHVPRSLQEVNRDFNDLKLYQKGSYNCVLGLLKTGEVLLMYNSRHLVTYDLKDGTFKHLTFPGIPYWFEDVVHEGSLNWIDILVNGS